MADPVTMTLAIGAMAGGQIYSGYQANKAAAKEAAAMQREGDLARDEALREAAKTEADAKKFRDRQILSYLKSGVTLEGSPLLILEDTIRQGNEEASAIRKRGYAISDLSNARAKNTRSTGKAQFITGITGAAGSAASGYATGRAAKIY